MSVPIENCTDVGVTPTGWTDGGSRFDLRGSPSEGLCAARRTTVQHRVQTGVIEAYLAGEGSLKGLATKAGIDHSLVHYWLKKYHAGELTLDLQREEESVETAQHIAALER